MRLRTTIKFGLCAGAALLPHPLWACAACYGQSDSAMAAGMNWGIVTLLGMIVFVLGGVAGFFFFLIRRSTATTARSQAAQAQSWNASWPVPAGTTSVLADESFQRGALKRESVLAQRRKHCAQSPTAPLPLTTSRARS